jgi:CheY-like chemotaxis protein
MRVLVVEEHPSLRQLIRSILELGHAEVEEAPDGHSVVAAYTSYHPDWVLMDLSLRGMDGLDATRLLKRAHPEAKVMIVTDQDSLTLRRKAREAGAGGVLTKDKLFQELSRTNFLPAVTGRKR